MKFSGASESTVAVPLRLANKDQSADTYLL
jgi:hypothetical protein